MKFDIIKMGNYLYVTTDKGHIAKFNTKKDDLNRFMRTIALSICCTGEELNNLKEKLNAVLSESG